VLVVSILPLSTFLIFEFGIVQTVWYFFVFYINVYKKYMTEHYRNISKLISMYPPNDLRYIYVRQTKFGRHIVFVPFLIILLLLSFFLYFFLPPNVYPTHFSATTERKSMKLNSNVKHYEQTTFGIFKMAAVAMETAKMLNN
jgi:hypothetical protein